MHGYATESNERIVVPFFLAAISILGAFGLHLLVDLTNLVPPWWVDVPSAFGLYGILYRSFDVHVWRNSFLRQMGIVSTPNLNGIWRGYLTSSFDQHANELQASARIVQTWTGIKITLKTGSSVSQSIVAALSVEASSEATLSYEYLNEPLPNANPSMQMHRGFARLGISGVNTTLDGVYFSGRGRQNYGHLHLQKDNQ